MNLPASASIIKHFSSIPDPRIDRRKRHKLSDIFFIALCASICVVRAHWGIAKWRNFNALALPISPLAYNAFI